MRVKRFFKNRGLRRLALIGAVVAVSLSACMGGSMKEDGPYHHLQNAYRNPPGSAPRAGGPQDWVPFFLRRFGDQLTNYYPLPPREYLMEKKDILAGIEAVKDGDRLTWLGHAAFLLTMDGKTILTDPFLSDYATGLPPLGPKRSVAPALTVKELPPIDVIVVSHNHYDHLDAPTIEALPNKDRIRVVVPLGMGAFFTERGYSNVIELDWHEATTENGLKITVVPAIHNSARSLFDRNHVLWGGFVLETAEKRLYFAGDTGYGPVFKEMGEKYGPLDYALIPIGAYNPRKIMKPVHVNPEEAVALGQDMKAKTIVAMHWGTIHMTDEPFDEPPRRFKDEIAKVGWAPGDAWVLKIGETRKLD